MSDRNRGRYLIVGLVMGGLWWFNRDQPLLGHALQMLAVMAVVTVLQIVLRRRRGQRVEYLRLIGTKLLLLGVAVGAQWLLTPILPRASLVVAGILPVLVAVLGPRLEETTGQPHGAPQPMLRESGKDIR